MNTGRTTLADVARRSGYSVMTVSRALRPGTSVAARTRTIVENAARELGYRADPFLSSLVNYRRNRSAPVRNAIIAYVTNYAPGTRWKEWPVLRDYYAGFSSRAASFGYGVEDFSLRSAGNVRRAAEILRHRGYVGVVIAPAVGPAAGFRLDLTGLAAVTFGQSVRVPRLHYVAGNVFRACKDVMHELKRRGYRRPGFAATDAQDARVERLASSAFLGVQGLFVLPPNRVPICLETAEKLAGRMVPWIRRHRIDVVIGMGVATGRMLEKAGLALPDDLGFASLSLDADDDRRYAGMKMDHLQIGEAAAEALHAQILRGECGVPERARGCLVDARWHEGETLFSGGSRRCARAGTSMP